VGSRRIRKWNRRYVNPAMLRLAGRRYWYAARVEHVGRRSGRAYATPVTAVPIAGGFAVPLPYGVDVDWCRNLRAAGGGVVQLHGRRCAVTAPTVTATQAILAELPLRSRLVSRVFGIRHWLRLETC
jgi:deazaflavin-dependent oxidoreductase (nitroreductase family)